MTDENNIVKLVCASCNESDKHKLECSANYSQVFEHDMWRDEIPFLNFPSDWKIKIVPPFNGAVVRFWAVRDKSIVSVYLDCYSLISSPKYPYWEIFPYNGDVFQCPMDKTDELIEAITFSLDEQDGDK